VTKTTAGDYAHIGDFNYDYAPGSGEEVMQHAEVASASSVSPGDIERFSAVITQAEVSAAKPATATLKLPPASAEEAAGGSEPQLFAKVTVTLAPMPTYARTFHLHCARLEASCCPAYREHCDERSPGYQCCRGQRPGADDGPS